MNFRKVFRLSVLACAVAVSHVQAQDIHFTQFDMSPLTINPALTGYHNGMFRAQGIYRNQWASVTTPFVTTGLSFDMPIAKNIGQDDYLSAGVNFFSDKSGDGNLLNNTVLGSVAYHKFLGSGAYPKTSISLGMQGGFAQKSIDLARLYFSDEFQNGGYNIGSTSELLKNKVSNFLANVGLNLGQRLSNKWSMQVGLAANNLNQPSESFQKQKRNNEVGLGLRYNAQLGAIGYLGERFSVRPGILFQSQSSATEMIAGTEVNMILGDAEVKSNASKVFLGGWTRAGDAILYTAGVEFKGFRVGFGYDQTTNKLKNGANANGWELGVTYVKPNPLDFARRTFFPCARF
jgi:type IX secretion system PorP/SprF family membrane protein